MITIEIEFTTKTVLGMTEAKVYKSEYGNSGELMERSHEDDMVKWVQKALHSENVIRPMITFSYDNDSVYGVSTARIIFDYCNRQEIVKWDDRGNVIEHIKDAKIDARTIRKLYRENIDRLGMWEAFQNMTKGETAV